MEKEDDSDKGPKSPRKRLLEIVVIVLSIVYVSLQIVEQAAGMGLVG